MDYRQSLEYLLKYADYERLPRSGIVWDLRRIERLLKRLGDPQYAARAIHVAGTKGKGSTSAMIASILKLAGCRVGLYTSPHLLSFTERIRFDGRPIAEVDWARLVEAVQPHVEAENALGDLGELTTFEILTAMAFLYYNEVGADYQVVEVGLGGRLDATNVVQPEVCVITSISYDHIDVLGDTLAKIAGEKAGIIKPGVTVVTAPQSAEAMEVIERVCREKGAPLIKVGRDITWRRAGFDEAGQDLRVRGRLQVYNLYIPLLGGHQLENAANAVAAAEVLSEKDKRITPEAIVSGLRNVDWPGRLQVLQRHPWVVVDGAHNAYSMHKLGAALRQYFTFDKLTLILGFSGDKDIPGMVAEVAAMTGDVILAASRHPRSVPPARLSEEFRKHGVEPRVVGTVAEAVRLAVAGAGPADLVCAAGSMFVVAEVMEALGGHGQTSD